MNLYDAVRSANVVSSDFGRRLGFDKVFEESKDFKLASDAGSSNGRPVILKAKGENITAYLKNGASALIPQNPEAYAEIGKYAKQMLDYGSAVVVDVSVIENAYGTYRALLLGKASECVALIERKGIGLGIATLAARSTEVLSSIQLIAIAKTLGIGEDGARNALAFNRKIFSMG
ncbi:MAG: hypothetical protein M1544_01875 [Candidatus Marsarchaeota archaeon]|nr:hypothetical protein [Candidatus Marsarchaeota archaeon]MCL5102083.1 hypothetical protein [Candidatus Marsarchaeota archaeon]